MSCRVVNLRLNWCRMDYDEEGKCSSQASKIDFTLVAAKNLC